MTEQEPRCPTCAQPLPYRPGQVLHATLTGRRCTVLAVEAEAITVRRERERRTYRLTLAQASRALEGER